MKLVYKTIYWLALAFITLIFVIWLAVKLVPLEFRKSSYEKYFQLTEFFGIPIAIIVAIIKIGFMTADKERKRQIIKNHILVAAILIVISILYIVCTALDGLCSWSKGEVLFRKESNGTIKIVQRDFGCGAVDGADVSGRLFIRAPVTPLFYYYKAIDTTTTDMRIWEKVRP